jgi:hypothetical protein
LFRDGLPENALAGAGLIQGAVRFLDVRAGRKKGVAVAIV